MRVHQFVSVVLLMAAAVAVSTLTACEEKKPAPGTPVPASSGASRASTDEDGHDHGHEHGSSVIALGEQTIGAFSAKASRDQGDIVAGKDAPIDVTVTPVAGSATKAASVRFWIGTQDAKGSAKAKAEIEDPKEPNRWHVHVEIPNPVPADSKLWVEIEDEKGQTAVGSFDLKR